MTPFTLCYNDNYSIGKADANVIDQFLLDARVHYSLPFVSMIALLHFSANRINCHLRPQQETLLALYPPVRTVEPYQIVNVLPH